MLALYEQLNLIKKFQGKPARDTAKPDADAAFTRIDPEIDEIRNGNVDTGCSVADINSLKASFPEFYQVKFVEDNQATITVMSTGSSASMRHMNKTQNINFKWLKQQFECNQFNLLNVGTSYQVAARHPHKSLYPTSPVATSISLALARQRWKQLATPRSLLLPRCQS